MVRANFGRFSVAVCNDEVRTNLSVDCLSEGAAGVMRRRCDGRSGCRVESSAQEFGSDPCPGTPKYLEVHYKCEKPQVGEEERIPKG